MYDYRATLAQVLDADLVALDVDLGFWITSRQSFRLMGIMPTIHPEERADAVEWLERELGARELRVVPLECDRNGVWSAHVWVLGPDRFPTVDVAGAMIDAGVASPLQPWDGDR